MRVAQELVLRGIQVSSGGVRGVWQRHGLLTKHDRLLRLEKASAERQISSDRAAGPAPGALQPGVPRTPYRSAAYGRAGRGRYLLRRRAQGRRQGLFADRDRLRQPLRRGGTGKGSACAAGGKPVEGRLYANKLPLTAVQLLNNDVLPTFEQHGAKVEAVLSDNGREFCGREDQHPYELFLQLEGIEHKRTRVRRPQSNGIIERLHRTLLDEHFRVEGRKTWFETIEEMQAVLDDYLVGYNDRRPHQGRGMNG